MRWTVTSLAHLAARINQTLRIRLSERPLQIDCEPSVSQLNCCADIWVMDAKTEYFEQTKALEDTDPMHVRGVDGVEWAVKLF